MFEGALTGYHLHRRNNKMDMKMRTFSGKLLNLENPEGDDIDITDIAHQLSMQVRFNGACSRFYSNAEHSVNAALIAHSFPDLKVHPLIALLHDAAEAYVGDMISPIKKNDKYFKDIEINILQAIYKRFEVPIPLIVESNNNLKVIDKTLTQIEGEVLVSGWERLDFEFLHMFAKAANIKCERQEQAFETFLGMYMKLKAGLHQVKS